MTNRPYRVGDLVVYEKNKYSTSPGHRAREIQPSGMGEGYHYIVDKYWVVSRILKGGQLRLKTRTGKSHVVDAEDRSLRRASWWERQFWRSRFPGNEPAHRTTKRDQSTLAAKRLASIDSCSTSSPAAGNRDLTDES